MSELLKQIEKANEQNRRNVYLAMEEFAQKLAMEANGFPMEVKRYQDRYIVRENGEAEVIKNAG